MSTAKIRTSFAFDAETRELIRQLSRKWNVSQAETVRRAIREAALRDTPDAESVREQLSAYRAGNHISRAKADAYLRAAVSDRSRWRDHGSSFSTRIS